MGRISCMNDAKTGAIILISLALLLAMSETFFAQTSLEKRLDSSAASATAQNGYGSGLVSGLLTNWKTMAGLLIAISLSIAAIVMIIAHGTGNYKLKIFAKTELKQVLVNVLIIVLFVFFAQILDTLADQITIEKPDGSVMDCSIIKIYATGKYGSLGFNQDSSCSAAFGLYYMDYFTESTITAADTYIQNSRVFSERAAHSTGKYATLWAGLYAGVNQAPDIGFRMLSQRNSMLYEHSIGILTLLETQKSFLILSNTTLAPLLIVMGIILRSFYMTRRSGGLLLAIGLNLFFVLPMLYVFSWYVWKNTYYPPRVELATSACPGECMVAPPLAYVEQGSDLYVIYGSLPTEEPLAYDYSGVSVKGSYGIDQAYYDVSSARVKILDKESGTEIKSFSPSEITKCTDMGGINLGVTQSESPECINSCPQECREIPFPLNLPQCQENEKSCQACSRFCYLYRIPSAVNTSALIDQGYASNEIGRYIKPATNHFDQKGIAYCNENCPVADCPLGCRTKLPEGYFKDSALSGASYSIDGGSRISSAGYCSSTPAVISSSGPECTAGCRVKYLSGTTLRPWERLSVCSSCDLNKCPDSYRYELPEVAENCNDPKYSSCPGNCRIKTFVGGYYDYYDPVCRNEPALFAACSAMPDACFVELDVATGLNSCDRIPANCKLSGLGNVMSTYIDSTGFVDSGGVMVPPDVDPPDPVIGSSYRNYLETYSIPAEAIFGCENSLGYSNNYVNCQTSGSFAALPSTGCLSSYSGPLFFNDGTNDSDQYDDLMDILKNSLSGYTEAELRTAAPENEGANTTWVTIMQQMIGLYDDAQAGAWSNWPGGASFTDDQKNYYKVFIEEAIGKCSQCPVTCRYTADSDSGNSITCKNNGDAQFACEDKFCPSACKANKLGISDRWFAGQCLGCEPDCIGSITEDNKCPDYCLSYDYCPLSATTTYDDTCQKCMDVCDPACILSPPIRMNCAELCSPGELTSPLDPVEAFKTLGMDTYSNLNSNLPDDIKALAAIYGPAYVLPLFAIVILVASIRTLSTVLGGDIDIPGLNKVL